MSSPQLLSPSSAQEDLIRYQQLVESVIDYAIYMLDPNGNIVSWNRGAQRFKGYAAAEIIGQHFSRFYTPEDRAKNLPARVLEIAAGEGKYEGEGWRVRKDGSRFWAYVVVDPIRAATGELTGFAKITRDITDKKKAQEQLEHTREVLAQTQKMEAIGQLTGGVAHDFNNLLMAVLGSLELLRKRLPDDPVMKRLLDNAVLGAQRGASLTQRMLAFARRQEMAAGAVTLPELFASMKELLTASLGASATVELKIKPGIPAVIADENQLSLAILNLSVNARDAMPDGGTVTISADEMALAAANDVGLPRGRYVRLMVSDTGIGMDEETLRHASEPFFTTKGVGKGTGLGLSMVEGMTGQLGGKFVLTSRPGHGTSAEMWLRIAGENLALREGAKAVAALSEGRKLRILAVDDDHLVLFNTAEMLRDLGHTVLEASSGQAALNLLGQGEVDLLITDQVMPRMTGAQLVAAAGRAMPPVPAILATGYAETPADLDPKVVRLKKPFTQQELHSAIERISAPPQ